MSGHTPGPWLCQTQRTDAGICHKIGPFPPSAGTKRVRHACIYVDYPTQSAADKELLANAILIAAAPELLEALTEAIEHMTWSNARGQLAYDNARAAIAKATQS